MKKRIALSLFFIFFSLPIQCQQVQEQWVDTYNSEQQPAKKRSMSTEKKLKWGLSTLALAITSALGGYAVYKNFFEEPQKQSTDTKAQEKMNVLYADLDKATVLSDIDRAVREHPEYMESKAMSDLIKARRNAIIDTIDVQAARNTIHGIRYRILNYPIPALDKNEIKANGIPNELFISKQRNVMSPVIAALTDTLQDAKAQKVDQNFIRVLRANGALE